jgi:hypothetical protein
MLDCNCNGVNCNATTRLTKNRTFPVSGAETRWSRIYLGAWEKMNADELPIGIVEFGR